MHTMSCAVARVVPSVLCFAALACIAPPRATALDGEVWRQADIRQVRVGGEIGRRIAVTIDANLLKLDLEKDFLGPLAARSRKDGYVAVGKLLDAAARFAAYRPDDALLSLKNRLVDRVIAQQQSDGYIGIMAPESRMTSLWDVHEMGYLVYGLLSNYELFADQRSLTSARRLADYIIARWSDIPADWGAQTGVATSVAVTGLERSMLRLHRCTGDEKYLDFCVRTRSLPQWTPAIVIGRRPLIEGHIYAYLARALAQLELHDIRPEENLPRTTRRAMDFLTAQDGMAITGGCGQWEIWTDDQDVRGELGETCATAYQLRVYDFLLRTTHESRWGDLMERTIHNALFAAQSPDGALIRYYAPLEGPREYFPLQNYCCPANYRRIVAELPQMVYCQDSRGVIVNLFAPSHVDVKLPAGDALRITQETDYPSSGRVLLRVGAAQPAAFALRLRIPRWCPSAQLRVNDEPITGQGSGGGFAVIERTWRDGDCVRVDMPMPWRLVLGRKRQSGRAAVMRGPLVFCLDPSQNKRLESRDGADLGRITLDPESFSEPLRNEAVRPNGVACTVRAWTPGYHVKRPGDLTMTLTEFADPRGAAVYFRLQDLTQARHDELCGPTAASP